MMTPSRSKPIAAAGTELLVSRVYRLSTTAGLPLFSHSPLTPLARAGGMSLRNRSVLKASARFVFLILDS